jgi:hypothetical protein
MFAGQGEPHASHAPLSGCTTTSGTVAASSPPPLEDDEDEEEDDEDGAASVAASSRIVDASGLPPVTPRPDRPHMHSAHARTKRNARPPTLRM